MAKAATPQDHRSRVTTWNGGFRRCKATSRARSPVASRPCITSAGVAAVVLLLIVFLLGKRSGKRKTTLLEIRRV